MSAEEWRRLTIFCAGTSWDGVRLPDQHLAERLAGHGPVLYVDPPVSPAAAGRLPDPTGELLGSRLRRLGPRLARLTPQGPPGAGRPLIRHLTRLLLRRAIRRAAAELGGEVSTVVAASLDDVLTAVPGARRVLYATDDYVAGAALMRIPRERLEQEERARGAEADLVVAISPALEEHWRPLTRRVLLLPNGVDYQAFAATDSTPVADDVRLPQPIAGLIGHISDRIDFRYLEAVADAGHSLLLVGPRAVLSEPARLDRLLARPNVQWTGARPFSQLSGYLRAIKVGLVPYAVDDFNRASFPLKTLEYLAAGRAAVATDLPAIRWLATPLVTIAETPEAFATAVGAELAGADDPIRAGQRRALAAEHGWDRRTSEFVAAMKELG